MLCNRCKKRIAIIFLNKTEDNKSETEGVCLGCAKELGLKPVDDLIEKMGITEENIEKISEEINDLAKKGNPMPDYDIRAKAVIFNREQIQEIIPHRDPFLLIDEVTEYEAGQSVTAVKHVTGREDFFRGHFPEYKVMPGVLILEAMAQAGAVVFLSMEEYRGKIAFFTGADNVKWRRQVKPGDTLELKVKIDKMKMGIGIANGEAYADGQLACSATIKFAVQR